MELLKEVLGAGGCVGVWWGGGGTEEVLAGESERVDERVLGLGTTHLKLDGVASHPCRRGVDLGGAAGLS